MNPIRVRHLLFIFCGLLFVSGLSLIFKGLSAPVKAALAPPLLNHAWERTLKSGTPQKPWPRMDSQTIAKLSFPKQRKEFIILQGVSGQVLAFAPGWHDQSAPPHSKEGMIIISAHRDTHFQIFKDFQAGDRLILYTQDGLSRSYTLSHSIVTETPRLSLSSTQHHSNHHMIALVTCYPLSDWQPRTNKRLIFFAYPEKV